jgi:hypothetical protein
MNALQLQAPCSRHIGPHWLVLLLGQALPGSRQLEQKGQARPGRVAHPFAYFPVDEDTRLDNTTQVRQRRVAGFAFSGGRPFRV